MVLIDNKRLYNALLELSIIPKEKLEEVYKASEKENFPLGEYLLEKDLISDENLGKIFADFLKVPFVRLSEIEIPQEVLKILPEVVAKKQDIISFKKDNNGLHIAMKDPTNKEIIAFLKKKIGLPVIVYLATKRDLDNVFYLYNKEASKAFDQILKENIEKVKKSDGKNIEPPIIKIVDTIISYAYQNKASDIHIEPSEKNSLVRFRIDGILHDIVLLPIELHDQIVSRVKVLSKLRTDEHQQAQDGKITFEKNEEIGIVEDLDLRVSIVPITEGEKVVLRILSERSRQFSLLDLGVGENYLQTITKAFERPYGMILATGPTGCGKTTTMYAILKILNRREVNIMTIEDPVEYEIQGINQIQVNQKTGLTFAAGLRSIVRQDPNIILVGEIRDEETAGIAINSAMTGHLVLSTLHTNDSSTAIPRLLDMKIEPFLVASSVNVIIAQRLVRKICLKCRYSYEVTPSDLEKYFSKEIVVDFFKDKKTIRIYKGKGCPVCHNTGYSDRIGIFEVLTISEEIKEAITAQKDAGEIKEIAIKEGMLTMLKDGLVKILNGITTIDEIVRVTSE